MSATLHFQLVSYEFVPGWAVDLTLLGSALASLAKVGEPQFVVIEVISDREAEPPAFAVMVSIADGDPMAPPQKLTCWLAFSNRVAWCDAGRRAGFPMVEAEIVRPGGTHSVQVNAARYTFEKMQDASRPRNAAALAVGKLLVVEQPALEGAKAAEHLDTAALAPVYDNHLVVPDAADAHASVLVREFPWKPVRALNSVYSEKASVDSDESWYPDLHRLLGSRRDCSKAWTGTLVGDSPLFEAPVIRPAALQRPSGDGSLPVPQISMPRTPTWLPARRQDLFGPPRFAFDDVEIIGFRLDLSEVSDVRSRLDELVKPLNFHLDDEKGRHSDDFHYAVATPVLVVELLRYGRMRLTKDWPPVRALDYQAQHELLLRVLVGRVDDDTTQAREAAIHVPAIFVDNPWSKSLGREVQGFEKYMASFCVSRGAESVALPMNGRLPGHTSQSPISMMQIDRVVLVENFGAAPKTENDLLRIEYSESVDQATRPFERVDSRGVAATLTPSGGPWRQSDFDAAEFRRSFARPVVARGFSGFRSIQVSPVDSGAHVEDPDRTWINGTMSMRDLRYRFPSGAATLAFPGCEGAPPAWQALRGLIDGARISLPSGSWYRAQCSMVLSIEDGLRW